MNLVGFEGFAAYFRDAVPLKENRALRPDLVIRDDAAPERDGFREDGPPSLLRGAEVP